MDSNSKKHYNFTTFCKRIAMFVFVFLSALALSGGLQEQVRADNEIVDNGDRLQLTVKGRAATSGRRYQSIGWSFVITRDGTTKRVGPYYTKNSKCSTYNVLTSGITRSSGYTSKIDGIKYNCNDIYIYKDVLADDFHSGWDADDLFSDDKVTVKAYAVIEFYNGSSCEGNYDLYTNLSEANQHCKSYGYSSTFNADDTKTNYKGYVGQDITIKKYPVTIKLPVGAEKVSWEGAGKNGSISKTTRILWASTGDKVKATIQDSNTYINKEGGYSIDTADSWKVIGAKRSSIKKVSSNTVSYTVTATVDKKGVVLEPVILKPYKVKLVCKKGVNEAKVTDCTGDFSIATSSKSATLSVPQNSSVTVEVTETKKGYEANGKSSVWGASKGTGKFKDSVKKKTTFTLAATRVSTKSASGNISLMAADDELETTITAQEQPITYTVKYNLGLKGRAEASGDRTIVKNYTINSGSKFKLLSAAKCGFKAKPGFKFAGWSETKPTTDNPEPSSTKKAGTSISLADKTYYAVWREMKYKIIYHPNGGNGNKFPQEVRCSSDYTIKSIKACGISAKAGQKFKVWNTKNDGSGKNYTVGSVKTAPTSEGTSLNLYAQWDSAKFTVTYHNGSEKLPKTYDVGQTVDVLKFSSTKFTKPSGKFFRGWATTKGSTVPKYVNTADTLGCLGNTGCTKTITSSTEKNIDLYAVFGDKTYNLTVVYHKASKSTDTTTTSVTYETNSSVAGSTSIGKTLYSGWTGPTGYNANAGSFGWALTNNATTKTPNIAARNWALNTAIKNSWVVSHCDAKTGKGTLHLYQRYEPNKLTVKYSCTAYGTSTNCTAKTGYTLTNNTVYKNSAVLTTVIAYNNTSVDMYLPSTLLTAPSGYKLKGTWSVKNSSNAEVLVDAYGDKSAFKPLFASNNKEIIVNPRIVTSTQSGCKIVYFSDLTGTKTLRTDYASTPMGSNGNAAYTLPSIEDVNPGATKNKKFLGWCAIRRAGTAGSTTVKVTARSTKDGSATVSWDTVMSTTSTTLGTRVITPTNEYVYYDPDEPEEWQAWPTLLRIYTTQSVKDMQSAGNIDDVIGYNPYLYDDKDTIPANTLTTNVSGNVLWLFPVYEMNAYVSGDEGDSLISVQPKRANVTPSFAGYDYATSGGSTSQYATGVVYSAKFDAAKENKVSVGSINSFTYYVNNKKAPLIYSIQDDYNWSEKLKIANPVTSPLGTISPTSLSPYTYQLCSVAKSSASLATTSGKDFTGFTVSNGTVDSSKVFYFTGEKDAIIEANYEKKVKIDLNGGYSYKPSEYISGSRGSFSITAEKITGTYIYKTDNSDVCNLAFTEDANKMVEDGHFVDAALMGYYTHDGINFTNYPIPQPVRDGYRFAGWKVTSTGKTDSVYSNYVITESDIITGSVADDTYYQISPDCSMTITAQWQKEYTVIFSNKEDETTSHDATVTEPHPSSIKISYGETLPDVTPITCSHEKYQMTLYPSGGTITFDKGRYEGENSVSTTATHTQGTGECVWEGYYYKNTSGNKVMVYASDGTSLMTYPLSKDVTMYSVYNQNTLLYLPNPVRSGYVFMGWWTTPDGNSDGVKVEADANGMIDAKLVKESGSVSDSRFSLYAHWQEAEKTYQITFTDPAKGKTPSPMTLSGIYYDEDMAEHEVTPLSSDTPKSYTVTINATGNADGSDNGASVTIEKNGETISGPVVQEVTEGSVFTGYFATVTEETEENSAEEVMLFGENGIGSGTYPFKKDVIAFAKWHDDTTIHLPVPERPGYKFVGWFPEPDDGDEDPNDRIKTQDDTADIEKLINDEDCPIDDENPTIYAHWEEIKTPYTITLMDSVKGETPSPSKIENVYYKQLMSEHEDVTVLTSTNPPIYTLELEAEGGQMTVGEGETKQSGEHITQHTKGAEFRGYYLKYPTETDKFYVYDEAGEGVNYYPVESNSTAYADWYDDNIVELPTPQKDGYRFTGWYTEPDGGVAITGTDGKLDLGVIKNSENYGQFMPDKKLTLHAHWGSKITVTLDLNGGQKDPEVDASKYDPFSLFYGDEMPENVGVPVRVEQLKCKEVFYDQDADLEEDAPIDERDASYTVEATYDFESYDHIIPEMDDYHDNYYDSDGNVLPYHSVCDLGKNTTLYAKWGNVSLQLPSNDKDETKYRFLGWFDPDGNRIGDGGEYIDLDPDEYPKNEETDEIILIGRWKEKRITDEYTVHYWYQTSNCHIDEDVFATDDIFGYFEEDQNIRQTITGTINETVNVQPREEAEKEMFKLHGDDTVTIIIRDSDDEQYQDEVINTVNYFYVSQPMESHNRFISLSAYVMETGEYAQDGSPVYEYVPYNRGGLPSNSIWRTDADHADLLLDTLLNADKPGSEQVAMYEYTFTHDQVLEMKNYVLEEDENGVPVHGWGNFVHPDGLSTFIDTYLHPNVSEEPLDVTETNFSGVYDGRAHGAKASATKAKIVYSTDGIFFKSIRPSFRTAGEYTVYYRAFKPGYATAMGELTVNIAKAEPKLELSEYTKTIQKSKVAPVYITENLSEGVLSVETSDESIAKVYLSGNKVKIRGVAPGTATVVVRCGEKINYEGTEKKIAVTVE